MLVTSIQGEQNDWFNLKWKYLSTDTFQANKTKCFLLKNKTFIHQNLNKKFREMQLLLLVISQNFTNVCYVLCLWHTSSRCSCKTLFQLTFFVCISKSEFHTGTIWVRFPNFSVNCTMHIYFLLLWNVFSPKYLFIRNVAP